MFNVGGAEDLTILELAERVIARVGSRSEVRLLSYAEAYGSGFEELGARRPDVTRLRSLTGWDPTHSLDEAIDGVIAATQSSA